MFAISCYIANVQHLILKVQIPNIDQSAKTSGPITINTKYKVKYHPVWKIQESPHPLLFNDFFPITNILLYLASAQLLEKMQSYGIFVFSGLPYLIFSVTAKHVESTSDCQTFKFEAKTFFSNTQYSNM